MRLFFILILAIAISFLLLQGRLQESNGEKPAFLRIDEIGDQHHTKIDVFVNSIYQPDSLQLETLKKDYSNIWAHLNHLYETNEIAVGKEYYTENWFKQINHHYNGTEVTKIKRYDDKHELHIMNWASDGLVCSVVDSNVVFTYKYPDNTIKMSKANLELVLLFQGDNWRIDAIKFLDESPIK